MDNWGESKQGLSEEPHDGISDLLAQFGDDSDSLVDLFGDYFEECPDSWKQFCAFWIKYRNEQIEEEL